MAELAFDTLSAARRLEKEFDFTPRQAEGTAKLVHEQLIGKVATKDDAKALKSDVEKLDNRIEKLDNRIEKLNNRVEKLDNRVEELNEKIDIRAGELNEKIDTSVKELDESIKTVNASQIELKTDIRWIKLIGAAIVALILPILMSQLAMILLN